MTMARHFLVLAVTPNCRMEKSGQADVWQAMAVVMAMAMAASQAKDGSAHDRLDGSDVVVVRNRGNSISPFHQHGLTSGSLMM